MNDYEKELRFKMREDENSPIDFERFFTMNLSLLCIADTSGTFIRVNEAWEKTLGYKAEELQHKAFLDFVHPEDKQATLNAIAELQANKQVFNFVNRYRCKDGSYRFIEWRSQPHGDLIYASAQDITSQKETQRELKESEIRLKIATSNAEIGLWEWHVKAGETYFNEQWANLIGYKLEDISPINSDGWSQFIHPEDLATSDKKISAYLTGRTEYYECEVRVKHKSGEWIWVLARGKVVEWDENGEPILMLGTHINIAYIKKVEQELLEEKNKKELILSAVALASKELIDQMNYYRAIGNCFRILGEATEVDRVYLFQNSYDDKGAGTASQKIEWNSSSSTPQLNNPELQEVPFEAIDTFIEPLIKGKAFCGLVRQLENDRTRELLEAQGILSIVVLPIYVRGVFWGFVGFDECKYERIWTEAEFSTLSAFANSLEKAIERRLIEEELKASKKAADEANAAKSLFLANMSHEIRTPINGILGIIDLLSKNTLSSEQRAYIDILRKSTESLVNIINDILDLSKIESGSMELSLGPFELRKSIKEIVEIIEPIINEKGLAISTYISENVPRYLMGDFEKIKQVLLNLLSNAAKFTSKGNIEIHVENIQIEGDFINVAFSVKDTGIGIGEEQINTIFEPFTQADNTVSRRYGGTGLGLSICQKLVEMMKGQIWIESTLGAGTKVHFIIPLEEAHETSLLEANQLFARPKTEKRFVRSLHVLVVEDNNVNQLLVVKFLRKGMHTFKLASNGKEAVALFGQEKFDVILMDIQMPEMDGYTATRIIREKEKDQHTPIVALTAHAMKGYYERCMEAGMDYYLTKPIYFDKMETLFNEIFGEVLVNTESKSIDTDYATMIFEKLDSDEMFFKLMVKTFKENTECLMKEIRVAVLNEDSEKLRTSAHALKGVVAIFEANTALELAKELEMVGYNANLKNAGVLADRLSASVSDIIDCFNHFIADNNL
jgi:PAS domain S-box-containing protein